MVVDRPIDLDRKSNMRFRAMRAFHACLAYPKTSENTVAMSCEDTEPKKNTFYIEVVGAGLPEVDGLFVPSTAPPAESESGTVSTQGYWNGKMAWDRADGKGERRPSLSYSNTYQSWRISRLDGHLAYDISCEDELPPTDRVWHVYKKGVSPAPKLVIHRNDPREAGPSPNIVFVLGGPGTGKGTMCELAEEQLGWTHLSTGELLREELERGGVTAKRIDEHLKAGQLVPNDIVVTLLKDAMENVTRTTGKINFLLDGFPRSQNNLEGWWGIFGREASLPEMIYFDCPYDVLEKRIMGRAPYSGRSDDNLASVKLRFDTFKAETLPTVDMFRKQKNCVEIDSSQDRQAVYELFAAHLGKYTDNTVPDIPLSERAEMLLGLRPFPKS